MKRIIKTMLTVAVFTMLFSTTVFAATETESNNTRMMATVVAPNTDVTGSISSYDDIDWYKVLLQLPSF